MLVGIAYSVMWETEEDVKDEEGRWVIIYGNVGGKNDIAKDICLTYISSSILEEIN